MRQNGPVQGENGSVDHTKRFGLNAKRFGVFSCDLVVKNSETRFAK